ncbi:MCM-domain-containing protein [Neoconidiobolus thromboides FSU 785]|nr:MCM-domain-containing protein [Neoconidiobolus thromboides FSU 785]
MKEQNFHTTLRELQFKKGDVILRGDSMDKRIFGFLELKSFEEDLKSAKVKLNNEFDIFTFHGDCENYIPRLEEYLWKLYFYDETSENHEANDIIELFKKRYKDNQFKVNLKEIENGNRVTFDYPSIINPNFLSTLKKEVLVDRRRRELREIPIQVEQFMRNKPKIILKALSLCSHLIYLLETKSDDEILKLFESQKLHPLTFRLWNHYPITPISNFTSNMIERIITVHGTIVRASSIKSLATQIEFVCPTCHRNQIVLFEDGKYSIPKKCKTNGCKGKIMYPERGIDSATRTIDFQELKIQELKSECDDEDLGRIPKTLDCELTEELVDQVIPGDVVKCTGILKLRSGDESNGRFKSASNMSTFYLDSLSISKAITRDIINEPNSTEASENFKSKDLTEFSDKDLEFIDEVFNEPDLFKLIVSSFCPQIIGHELVKFGILLSLFGGRKRYSQENASFSIRGDPHVLIVGDPGLGKSQLLSAATRLAPRSVYVCGSSGVSSSGLTVSVVKESGSSDFALEAGALVLGDQGCCCIDEFDKMPCDYDALLEAMEQQSISIAKAGIVCSLPARTSIIAAANPVGGHYNKGKTVSENLKLSGALLSRFDLVFILLDKPDEKRDKFLSHHVMSLHSGNKKEFKKSYTQTSIESFYEDKSLLGRIKLQEDEEMDLLNLPLFRKYIAYARQYVHPKISPNAAKKIKDFYLELRAKHHSKDSIPITTRQLESLIRLVEARAKMELRELATVEDAEDVIELLRFSLFESYTNNEGTVEFQRSQNGSGMSRKVQIKEYVSKLNRVSNDESISYFTYDHLFRISQEMNLNLKMEFREFIELLNHHGYLLKKGGDNYKLSTS